MAKQTGSSPFTGRKGDLLGYRMGGGYYVRMVSSLTAERVKRDPAFKRTMQSAGLLARASRIASGTYRLLGVREHGLYRRLTGIAMQLLKQGRSEEEAFRQLCDDFSSQPPAVEVSRQQERVVHTHSQQPVRQLSFPDKLLKRLFSESPAIQEGKKIPVAGPLSTVNSPPSSHLTILHNPVPALFLSSIPG